MLSLCSHVSELCCRLRDPSLQKANCKEKFAFFFLCLHRLSFGMELTESSYRSFPTRGVLCWIWCHSVWMAQTFWPQLMNRNSQYTSGNEAEMQGRRVVYTSGSEAEMQGCRVEYTSGSEAEMQGRRVEYTSGSEAEMQGRRVEYTSGSEAERQGGRVEYCQEHLSIWLGAHFCNGVNQKWQFGQGTERRRN